VKVVLAEHEREITQDGFGITYIDGMTVDEFMGQCTPEEIKLFAAEGMRMEVEEPELFQDIISKLEM
jgi:hypothetical protein